MNFKDNRLPVFTSLRTFWSDYIQLQVHSFNLNNQFFVIKDFLKTLFGNLTDIEIDSLESLPVKAACNNCRNNHEQRRASVCETHVGCLKGALEGILNIPLDIIYEPEPYKTCMITVTVAKDDTGHPLLAMAKLKSQSSIYCGSSNEEYWIRDNQTQQTRQLSRDHYMLLQKLDCFRSAKEIAELLNIPVEKSNHLLDESYKLGLIDCQFLPNNYSVN